MTCHQGEVVTEVTQWQLCCMVAPWEVMVQSEDCGRFKPVFKATPEEREPRDAISEW